MSATLVKPCDEPCQKCGATDIHRVYIAKDQVFDGASNEEPPHAKYMRKAVGWKRWYVVREFIASRCKTCQYQWQALPLKAPKQAAP